MTQSVVWNGVVLTVDDNDPRAQPAATPSNAIPQSVTRLQGRLAINAAGLLAKTEALVSGADAVTQIWYADAANWERDNPTLAQLATALGLTTAQVDALFVQAASFQ